MKAAPEGPIIQNNRTGSFGVLADQFSRGVRSGAIVDMVADTVRHTFDLSGYRQEFELLRNAYGDNLQSAANPLAAVL